MTSVPSLNQIGRKLAKLAHREIFGWLAGWLANWLAPEFGFKAQSHYKLPYQKSTCQLKAFSSYPIVKSANDNNDDADDNDTHPASIKCTTRYSLTESDNIIRFFYIRNPNFKLSLSVFKKSHFQAQTFLACSYFFLF